MQIAQKHNGEIICADSRTIYKGLDIGTSKPSHQERLLVKHHLLDICEPDQSFNAAEFKLLANKAIEDISDRGKLPILVGGTGLYVHAVVFDYQFGISPDTNKRQYLEQLSVEQLQHLSVAKGIELPLNNKNKRHLVRAIELSGVVRQELVPRDNTLQVGVVLSKTELRTRVEDRVDAMVQRGLLTEVDTLFSRYGSKARGLQTIGYKEFELFLEGLQSLEDTKELVVKNTLNYAKRQITWFRRNPYIKWFESPEPLISEVDTFMSQQKT